MQLSHLQEIVGGLNSLSDLEKEHPVLGDQLCSFVREVRDCCAEGYGRLSAALGEVLALPASPQLVELQAVSRSLGDAGHP
jgi:hypothetical protein